MGNEGGIMKRFFLIGSLSALAILIGVVLAVGRGPKPQYPYMHADPQKIDPEAPINKEALIKDIDYYVALIDSAQADPYRQITKQSFMLKAAEMKGRVRDLRLDAIPLIDCYYYMQELAASLQDEHTKINFQPEWRKSCPDRFPLDIRIFEEKAYVRQDFSDANIPQYAELVRVADKPVVEMLSETQKFINVTLPHYKRQIAERSFDTWLQTYFKFAPPWKIVYRFEGEEKTVEVVGIPEKEFVEEDAKASQYSETSFRVGDEIVPLLEIPKFWCPDQAAYNKFMDDFFQKHKDKNYLVIDLRRNPGGDGRWGFFVLDYFLESSYITVKRFDFKISNEFVKLNYYYRDMTYYEKRIPRLLWWFPPLKTLHESYWMDKVYQAEIGEYTEERDTYRIPDPGKAKFKGKPFLLVSHFTNSAAVVFSAIFKNNKLGTIVGQETGGRETFTSDSISIQMPNSPLLAFIPVAILALPGNNPERGVLPDVEVEYSLEDEISQKDLDLERVKEIIRKDLGMK